jgi:hypothetical protein
MIQSSARPIVAAILVVMGSHALHADARGVAAQCDAECVENRRLNAGVKGFPAAGRPVLLESADGASPQQLAAQYQALLEIEDAKVQYDGRGLPGYVFGVTTLKLPHDFEMPRDQPLLNAVVPKLKTLFLAEGTETLQVERVSKQPYGLVIVLKESIRGIPVSDAQVVLETDANTDHVTKISGPFLPDRGLPRAARITAQDAKARAWAWFEASQSAVQSPPSSDDVADHPSNPSPVSTLSSEEDVRLADAPVLSYQIRAVDDRSQARLVWAVELINGGTVLKRVYVDALNGSIVGVADQVRNLTRRVFDSNNTAANPGTLLFSEGGWSSDIVATTAYTNVGLALSSLTPVAVPAMDICPYRISVRWVKAPNSKVYAESSMTTSGEWSHDLRFGTRIAFRSHAAKLAFGKRSRCCSARGRPSRYLVEYKLGRLPTRL